MDEKLLTPTELAEQWGVSVHTIHRLANRKNGLRAYKVGNLTRFKPSDVEAYLAAHTVKVPEKPTTFSDMKRFRYMPGMKVVSV
ncbi:MAG: helix-turn-helix domain-containing protein [Oscillospiraceae bacterium]|nr:helix-turn-helix domain-containing protein [Oscillospiraceae bacterium]